MRPWRACLVVVAAMVCAGLSSCSKEEEIVVYTTLDEKFARAQVGLFEARNSVHVKLVLDDLNPAAVTDKLANEVDKPVADVYWGSEPFGAIKLAGKGVLARYAPDTAAELPKKYADGGVPEVKPDAPPPAVPRWTGVGYRFRVLVRNTRPEFETLLKDISSVSDLTAPSLKGRIAISDVASQEMAAELAALYMVWGENKYRAWLLGLRENEVQVLKGRMGVVNAVSAGRALIGLSDSDLVGVAVGNHKSVEAVIPDQGAKQVGTLLLPMTLSLVEQAPHPEKAKQLIDFLSLKQSEESMMRLGYLSGSLREPVPSEIRLMDVDYETVTGKIRIATEIALTVLQDRLK